MPVRPPSLPRRRGAVVVIACLALSACGTTTTDDGDPAPASTTSQAPTPGPVTPGSGTPGSDTPGSPSVASSSEVASAPAASTPPPGDGPPTWQDVATGFDEPAAVLVDPRTGDDLVVELGGRLVTTDHQVVLDLTDRVARESERGLLDATATPDGTALIVHYSRAGDGATVVSRFPVLDDALADPADEQVLLTLDQPASNHNGGSVVFGPDDLLYVALGDGGRANDAFGNGADPGTPLGAILRLDVTSDPGEVVVPDDNPFVDGGGDERVWAHGVRNPWRIATDGQRWIVADVGQDAVEEVTVVPADAGPHDLGWPDWEGDYCRVDVCEDASLQPVATLTHDQGACSIIGAAVASTPTVDDGTAYWTDLCDPRVWRLDPATGEVVEDAPLPDGIPAYALDVDAGGNVVALTTDGTLLRRTRG